jgi:hypothetical protein
MVSFPAWLRDRVHNTDIVGLGVNVAVGMLLVGGLVGSFIVHSEHSGTTPPPLVDAGLKQPMDPVPDNDTHPADSPEIGPSHGEPDGPDEGK